MDPQRSLWTTYAMMLTVAVIWGAAWPVGRALLVLLTLWQGLLVMPPARFFTAPNAQRLFYLPNE